MISGAIPQHLVVAARSGFLTAVQGAVDMPWQRIAMQVNMGAASETLVDLGAAPMPTQSKGGMTAQDFIERTKAISAKEWDITVWLSGNAAKDDQTGSLLSKVQGAGVNFQRHINKRVFQVLNSGDGQTYGACYDGQDFFDSDHADAGAAYSTSQDNEGALALSLDNYETSWAAAQLIMNDQGEYTQYAYDQLVVPPALFRKAANIVGNAQDYGTGNRAVNPFGQMLKAPIVSPYLDSTAWHLIASSESTKPLILAMKEQPHLDAAWYEPGHPDGGRHFFKFYARYEVHYGDWRLAYQGNT